MRIAIMGSGGMGGYLGARLAAAGNDVTFIARGAHLAAMREGGLRVRGAEEITVEPVKATDDPGAIGAVDLVLFSVKLYDTDDAAAAIVPLMGEETCVLTVQNGIESAPRIAAQAGTGRVLGGAAYFPANISAPGEITFVGRMADHPHLVFGESGAGDSPRARSIAATFAAAGIDCRICDDTELMLWEKFCLIAGTSATTALCRQTVGVVRSDADMRWLLAESVAEAARVGRCLGIALKEGLEAEILGFLDGNPAGGKASQLVDLERGRRLELEGLSGAVVRLGREAGVPTPVHATVYAALKPFVDGA